VASHKKFAEKYHLNFPILSDLDGKVIKDYQAQGIFTKRITYLINPKGEILKIYEKVDPLVHAQEIIKDLKP
jgi:peroxiredoxin Q/BCP